MKFLIDSSEKNVGHTLSNKITGDSLTQSGRNRCSKQKKDPVRTKELGLLY